MTFYQIFEDYLTHLRIYAKARSVDQARFHGHKLADHFGMWDIDGVRPQGPMMLDEYIQGRIDAGWSRSTINGSIRVFKAAMRNSGRSCTVKQLRVTKRLPTVMNWNDVQLLLNTPPPGSDVERAIALAAYAGLRHQEILHLAPADVDLPNHTLRVTAKPEVGWSPKSHAERAVPFRRSGRLENVLLMAISRRAPKFDKWLFPGFHGRPLASIQQEVRRTFMVAHLYNPEERSGLHMLRRTWASRMLELGTDINTVRELGGWANLEVLLHYLRSSDEAKQRAIDKIE